MGSLQEKLAEIVARELEGDADLEKLPGGHVCGHIISPQFDGQTYESRHARLNRILEVNLTREELLDVGTLLTYTPEEWTVEIEE